MSEIQSINIVEDAEGELRVSSLIIAGRTDNQHASVLRIVRDNLADFESFGRVGFEIAPFETAGGTQRREIAHLNEPQATLLMTYMRNSEVVKNFKLALVAEFYRMRQALTPQFALPQTHAEALRELAASVEQNALLEAKIIADEPKVEYVDAFVADSDLRLLRNVAKSLSISEGELRSELLVRNWIYAEHTTRWSESKQCKETVTRYSAYSHKTQYFEPVPNHHAPRFKGEVMHTLKVTPAGAAAIARMYGQHLRAVEAVS
ncbi:Rha family transcriptional regulator [Leucobacter sp. UT-8R-CII-1-4]|uniref:Rha family transcriptional regulator n=1 Tax=Leucobacter sp. UT-8R-CII-1-4 TaxID=3040075 RepID=UPI0024A7AAF0|nr:Rha family transcriptional regulator [Leucobacter sp. UT-8R-CII-1-4]MDI6024500.1 Rha family transcriptional regulator [Leucobacter sp. UT-8R-CII-1-4]